MKKIYFSAFILSLLIAVALRAQPLPAGSGVYQKLTLGLDPASGIVTGYYEEILDAPNMSHQECSFFLAGKKRGDQYTVEAWSPGDKNSKVMAGTLALFAGDPSKPSVNLRLENLGRDCTALNPYLGKGQGALLDMSKSGAWTEVRVVENSKSFYFQNPDPASPTRGSTKRGTVLTVSRRVSDWVQVQSDQKPRGWIREADLFPLIPGARSAAPATASAETSSPAPKKSTPPGAAASSQVAAAPKPESKDDLLQGLNTLSAQAFAMALQVLENPNQRITLSEKRSELEKELNDRLSRLNAIDPTAYRQASPAVISAFLDLQYVKQDQQVLSLRLHQKIHAGLSRN